MAGCDDARAPLAYVFMHRTRSAASAPNSSNCLCAKALAQQHTAEFSDGCGDLQAVPRPGPWCRARGAVFQPMCTSQSILDAPTNLLSTEKESMICSECLCWTPTKPCLLDGITTCYRTGDPQSALGLSRKASHACIGRWGCTALRRFRSGVGLYRCSILHSAVLMSSNIYSGRAQHESNDVEFLRKMIS